MKLWDVSGDGRPWSVELDVCDLGGHLDFTRRAGAGTLSRSVRDAAHEVAAGGAMPLGFQAKLGLVRGKCLPTGMRAVEASYVSASCVSAFRAAFVRTVWSSEMPPATHSCHSEFAGWFCWCGPGLFILSGLGFA